MLFFKKNKSSLDKKFRVPRVWSNRELAKFAEIFTGHVVNVSGWKDEDKEGKLYSHYFKNASSYSLTNYKAEANGFQGAPGEIFLDLENDLPAELNEKFDVVFNHTTLEHIFNFQKAFQNLCIMSKDVVIVVVPYIQQIHGAAYSDYWRFTPHAVKELFKCNGFELRYCSANGSDEASIYLFCIGLKSEFYFDKIPVRFDLKLQETENLYGKNNMNVIGANVIKNNR